MKRLKYRECIKRFLAVAMLMLIAVNPVFTSINPAYGSGEISGEKNESELLTDETYPDILEQDAGSVKETDTEQGLDLSISHKEALETGKISYEQLELKTLVTKEDIDNLGHVKRLYEEEKTLNSTTYANADGTRTTYYFMHPVKYVDAKGDIKDIKLELKEDSKGNFVSAQSDVIATFPKGLEDGITLKNEDENVNLLMYIQKGNDKLSKLRGERTKANSQGVEYTYDASTSVEYQLTYTGIKENIIVSEYTGQTEYSFVVNTNGLKLVKKGRTYSLVDDKDNVKAVIGDVVIYTADNKNNMIGTMSSKTIKENETYMVTIHVDEEFLKSPDTTYPIIIDPTIEINSSSVSSAISDVAIFSDSTSDGNSGFLYAGRHSTVGKARFLMKFPGLNLSGIKASDRISNATLKLKDIVQDNTATTVACYVFGGSVWEESNASWDLCTTGAIKAQISTNKVYYDSGINKSPAHTYSYNITKAVKGWRAGNLNPNKGLIFKTFSSVETGTSNNMKAFASFERSDGKPTLVVTYSTTGTLPLDEGTIYLNNWQSGEYLGYFDGTIGAQSGLVDSYGSRIKWILRKVDGGYVLRPSYASTLYLAVSEDTSSNEVETVSVVDEDIPERCIWEITKIEDGKITIKNTYNGNYLFDNGTYVRTSPSLGTDEVYRKRVWRYVSASQYGSSSTRVKPELSSFTVGTCTVLKGETVVPKIIVEDDDTLWVNPEDFIYSGFNSTEVYYDSVLGTFTGITNSSSMYIATVLATHKVTGRTANFTVVTNPKAFLFAVEPEDDRDRTSWLQGTAGYIEDVGISIAEDYYGSFTKAETINKLKNDQYCIFVSRSHGGYVENSAGSTVDTKIITNEFEDTGVDYYLCANDLANLADNDLTNLKLALFVGCKTAGPLSTAKLPLTVVGKGATTAIGFEDTIYNDNANDWVEEFFKKIKQGSNIYNACNELREYAWYNEFGLDKFVIYGDSQLSFE